MGDRFVPEYAHGRGLDFGGRGGRHVSGGNYFGEVVGEMSGALLGRETIKLKIFHLKNFVKFG
jgi:hypothetical protein